MFLDIAIGILLAVWTSVNFNVALSFWVFPAVLFILLPDVDFFIELFKRGSVGKEGIKEHRRITHYPLAYIPVVILIFLLFGKLWGLIFSLAVALHFIHDSAVFGWGVQWLWPFSKKHYIFFRKSLYSEKPGLPFKFLYIWTPEQAEAATSLCTSPRLPRGSPDSHGLDLPQERCLVDAKHSCCGSPVPVASA